MWIVIWGPTDSTCGWTCRIVTSELTAVSIILSFPSDIMYNIGLGCGGQWRSQRRVSGHAELAPKA